MTVAESAPQADTRSICVICTRHKTVYNMSTDTERRAGLSAIAELAVEICEWTDKQTDIQKHADHDTVVIVFTVCHKRCAEPERTEYI